MRRRNFSGEVWTDERFISLTPEARLFMFGLLNVADREGRLEDKPRSIKLKIAPTWTADPEALLTEIAAAGLILRYAVARRAYIAILEFCEDGSPWHQTPHPREKRSVLPPPGERPGNPMGAPRTSLGSAKAIPNGEGGEGGEIAQGSAKDGPGERQGFHASGVFPQDLRDQGLREESASPLPAKPKPEPEPEPAPSPYLLAVREERDKAIRAGKAIANSESPRELEELEEKLRAHGSPGPAVVREVARQFYSKDGSRQSDQFWRDRYWSLHMLASQGIDALLPGVLAKELERQRSAREIRETAERAAKFRAWEAQGSPVAALAELKSVPPENDTDAEANAARNGAERALGPNAAKGASS